MQIREWPFRVVARGGAGMRVAPAKGSQSFVMAHLFTFLGPLLIVVGLVGSIRDLSGRSDRRF